MVCAEVCLVPRTRRGGDQGAGSMDDTVLLDGLTFVSIFLSSVCLKT